MAKCNIFMASSPSPKKQLHSNCFLEIAQLLKYSFEDIGYEVSVGKELRQNCLNLVLGYHLLEGKKLPPGYNCVVYQLEELTEEQGWQLQVQETLRSDCVVWDFSGQNVEYLESNGIKAIYKPLGFHEKMKRIQHKMNKDIDVLFYGSKNERRITILKELHEKFNLKVLFGVYGEARDAWIARSKIVLSLYYYEAKMFDDIRLSYLMNNKVFTIIEDSPFKKYDDVLVFAAYHEIVDACEYFINNKDMRSMITNRVYDEFSKYPETEFLQQALAKTRF
jgi:hypothetical protein